MQNKVQFNFSFNFGSSRHAIWHIVEKIGLLLGSNSPPDLDLVHRSPVWSCLPEFRQLLCIAKCSIIPDYTCAVSKSNMFASSLFCTVCVLRALLTNADDVVWSMFYTVTGFICCCYNIDIESCTAAVIIMLQYGTTVSTGFSLEWEWKNIYNTAVIDFWL